MDQENSNPIPLISKKMASENELPGLKEIKHNEKVMYKPELYDEKKHRSRPISAPMSKRTIRNRDLISKTKENISHSNLVEKEVEGLDPIEAFKKKLMFNTLNTERKRNPKLSKPIQIEIKKQYLNYKYKNFDPIDEEENLHYKLMNELKNKKDNKFLNKKSEIIYDPDAQYMINYNMNEIETDNLKNYVIKKKNERKKLNIKEEYMYKTDVDEIRNRNNRDGVSYNGNFYIAGPEYVGADEQVHDLCHKRNFISLPEKYIQYHKHLEELGDKSYSSTPNDNKVEVDNDNKNKIENNKKTIHTKEVKSKKTNSKSNININNDKLNNSFKKRSTSRQSSLIKTYYGSNSGYNALSRPALNTSLVKRHNVHRNNEHFNIEQIALRRLRYILNFNKIDKDHIYLIDCLKESNIPNDLIQLSFQNNFESLDELRNELLGHMLKDNVKDNNKKNITKKEKEEEKNQMKQNINNKSKSSIHSNEFININGNEKNYCNISKNFKLSDSNLKYEKIKGEEPKSSRKIRILPKIAEPTTPKELLYIIDNYNRLTRKNNNDYKKYSIFNNSKNNVFLVNTSNNSVHKNLGQNLKSNSKVTNPELSYHEILKALQK